MQAVIYAGLRNAARDQAIAAAMENESAATVGLIYSLSPSAVYGARRRITSLATFDLKLLGGGGGSVLIGKVAAESFRKAALGAYRNYYGTFRQLELPCWVITDGSESIQVLELRRIDTRETPL